MLRAMVVTLAMVVTGCGEEGFLGGGGGGNNTGGGGGNGAGDDLGTGDHNGAVIPSGAELADSWTGNLSEGTVPDSLDFLEANFCVPGTHFDKFDGAHVYYTYAQTAGTQVYVRATPDEDLTLSLIVSQLPGGSSGTGPGAVADPCETSLNYQNANPGVSETIKLTSTTEPYHLVIGVAGAFGATSGEFAVDVYEE